MIRHLDDGRMQVLYLLNSSGIGGGNRSMQTLWAFVQPLGVGIHAVAPQPGPITEMCAQSGIECSIVPHIQPTWRHPVQLLQEFKNWTSTINERKPALLHSDGFVPSRCVSFAAYRKGLPHICHVRFGEGAEYLRWVFRGLPKPDVFLFCSHALSNQERPVLERMCPGARFEVVHNAVDLESFRPAPRAAGPPRIGIVANLIPLKGHEDFLRMARILTQQGVDARFWVIGEDIHSTGYDAQLRRLAADLQLTETTTFFGYRADIPALMAQLDVLVCASHEEPFGRNLIEAMACAKPVVATRVGGIPEVVLDGITGLLVPPNAPGDLAAAVTSLLESPALAARLGAAGRARAESDFGGQAQAQRIKSIYDQLSV